jgi:hypothetical protein
MFSFFYPRNPPSPVTQTRTPVEYDNPSRVYSQAYGSSHRPQDDIHYLQERVRQLEQEKQMLINERNVIQYVSLLCTMQI